LGIKCYKIEQKGIEEKEMASQDTIGENIRNARKSLSMTQEEASSALGISRSALSLMEHGKRRINSTDLARMAELYHKTISDLLISDHTQKEDSLTILLRAKNISKKDRIQLNEFRDLCRRYSDLENRVYGPSKTWRVPLYPRPSTRLRYDARRVYVENIANDERQRLQLGNAPIRDVFSLLDKQGIRIFKLPLSHELSGGFLYTEEFGQCILVNVNHGKRMVYTAAHEYYHFLVDRENIADICSDKGKRQMKRESLANHFAACFLIPRYTVAEFFERYVGRKYDASGVDVLQLSREFGVSYSAMLTRLKDLGLVSDDAYVRLQKLHPEKMASDLGLPEMEIDPTPFPGRYVYMATRLYFRGEISIGKLAEYLKKSIRDTQKFVKDLRDYTAVEEN
jgi:Zn-dependent peptidase ImmA (M78 family)/transcriptional regulator with XRE-family HTH domain